MYHQHKILASIKRAATAIAITVELFVPAEILLAATGVAGKYLRLPL